MFLYFSTFAKKSSNGFFSFHSSLAYKQFKEVLNFYTQKNVDYQQNFKSYSSEEKLRHIEYLKR